MSQVVLPNHFLRDFEAMAQRVAALERQLATSEDDERLVYGLRFGYSLMGGGTITWTGTNFSWNSRFIVISQGRDINLAQQGHFNIDMPPEETVIRGVSGHADVTVAGGVIPMASGWDALWYELPLGEENNFLSRPANFRIASYVADFVMPSNWVMIATRFDDPSPHLVVNSS